MSEIYVIVDMTPVINQFLVEFYLINSKYQFLDMQTLIEMSSRIPNLSIHDYSNHIIDSILGIYHYHYEILAEDTDFLVMLEKIIEQNTYYFEEVLQHVHNSNTDDIKPVRFIGTHHLLLKIISAYD